ncbi:preprotein translocase subunit SecG [Candidatus Daviesbacteria bacterium RIFCSPHIGHO2_02_FULL_36_13]|uniref:Protein-export membrane protein SecG n=1 Tax=Candidatus Daviesbacteria bacterium RIFCSPHIGHO2_02_FULL_36_13 TaxID=1797768 RepID=A0A1F5JRD2_9BACT|nr:MAG: preprotein translocase subunit SecG [Candidatus Daviesbacteria bacterium RIFCSPHIGHO2_02_FULL_36_13]
MNPVVSLFQIILGILLVIVIIIQQKGSGIGGSFGGDMGFYRTKRGAEKLLFYITIGLALLFILSSLVGLTL